MFDDDGSTDKLKPICITCGEQNNIHARAMTQYDVNNDLWEIFFDCYTCLTSFRKGYPSYWLANQDWLVYRHRRPMKRENMRFLDRPDRKWRYTTKYGWVENKEYGRFM